MMKNKNENTVTSVQKDLSVILLILSVIYLFYHTLMSVLNRMIVFEDTIWQELLDITLWVTLGFGVLWLIAGCFHRSGKKRPFEVLKAYRLPKEHLILLILLVMVLISVISIKEYSPRYDWWIMNRTNLLDYLGQALILFPLGCYWARHRDAKIIRIPFHLLILTFIFLETFVLVRVFGNEIIQLPNGGQIGIDDQIELILNCNRNTTGLWAYCMIFCSLYLLVTSCKWLKPLYIFGLLVNIQVLSMSKSRASVYGTCLTLGLLTAIFMLYQKKLLNGERKKKILASVISGIAATVIAYFAVDLFYRFYLQISGIEALRGVKAVKREFIDDQLSGRTGVWVASLKSMFYDARSFFFGVSPVGIVFRIEELFGRQFYTHNQILEVGCACGVPSMILFIFYCVKLFQHSVKVCFRSGHDRLRAVMPSVGCFLMLIANMMEATLLGFSYFSGMIFMVAGGALTEQGRSACGSRKIPAKRK